MVVEIWFDWQILSKDSTTERFPKSFQVLRGSGPDLHGPTWAHNGPILELFRGLPPLFKCSGGYKIRMAL